MVSHLSHRSFRLYVTVLQANVERRGLERWGRPFLFRPFVPLSLCLFMPCVSLPNSESRQGAVSFVPAKRTGTVLRGRQENPMSAGPRSLSEFSTLSLYTGMVHQSSRNLDNLVFTHEKCSSSISVVTVMYPQFPNFPLEDFF